MPPAQPLIPSFGIRRYWLIGHPPFNFFGQQPRGRIPVVWRQRHGFETDRIQHSVDRRIENSWGSELAILHPPENPTSVIAHEWWLAGQEAIKRSTEAV